MEQKYNFNRRRDCRVFAMQTIYRSLLMEITKEEMMKELFESSPLELENTFALELIEGILEKRYDIEYNIQQYLVDGWELNRLEFQDRSILAVAGYELLYTDTPPSVVINEALEVAKKYSDTSSKKYINAILDKIAKR